MCIRDSIQPIHFLHPNIHQQNIRPEFPIQFYRCLLYTSTTSSIDHALDGFRVRAFQYLVKPYSDKELADLFDEIAKRLPAPSKYIEMNISGSTIRLRFSEILYAEHYRHQIYIYTADGKSTVIRQTFREFTKALSDCLLYTSRCV